MSLRDSIAQAQRYLEDMMKKHRYKKADKARDLAVEERMDYMNCAGKLNQCLTEFKITIKGQVFHIREGELFGRDTVLQEDELWDAAMGYMLVKDAQYALKSLYNVNSVSYAYDLLHGVIDYMNGGKLKMPLINGVRRSKERNAYGYLTSDKAISDKEALLETFFEELKRTGDIEACLAKAIQPAEREGGRRSGRSGGSGGNSQSYRERLQAIEDDAAPEILEMPDPDSVDVCAPAINSEPAVSSADEMRARLETVEDLPSQEEA